MASIIKCDTIQSTTSNVFFQNSVGTEYARFDSTGVFQLANPSSFAAGTAAAPSITATGDTNTGIFFPAADTIGFSEGGAEIARFDSSGNFGLGVTPSGWSGGYVGLQVKDAAFASFSSGYTWVGNNWYSNSGNKYIGTGNATLYEQNAGAHAWSTAASGTAGNTITFTQAMTLDASGNLAVGISSGYRTAASYSAFALNGTTGSLIDLYANSTRVGGIAATSGQVTVSSITSIPLVFSTADIDRARIDSSGNLLVGKSSNSFSTAGMTFTPGGLSELVASSSTVIAVNRLATDGTLIDFYQAGTKEGDISVSGTTVSYNGGHLSRYAQTIAVKDETILKGTLLSNLDEMNVYTKDGQPVANEQLNKVKVSEVEGDTNVAGVFVNWTYDEDHNVDEINMAMTGDMIIRIAQGVSVARGDLLMSAGDGTAKPQGDDIVRSKTVAKVTSNHVTCTYADGSYCVPCVLMAC